MWTLEACEEYVGVAKKVKFILINYVHKKTLILCVY
jgi:hypothetical protein